VLILLLWLGAIWLWWKKPIIRWTLLGVALAISMAFVLPGREGSPLRLRNRYVSELPHYEGVHYIWGGENGLGIDCSGLVRRALFQAMWKEGLFSLNPSLLRHAALFWWDDASARALSNEYHNQTKRIRTSNALTSEDPSQLSPGDLAITTDGIHVLAYIGNKTWIEADPELRRVILLPTANSADHSNMWLETPVIIARWQAFDESR
jgi:hypothetical protein